MWTLRNCFGQPLTLKRLHSRSPWHSPTLIPDSKSSAKARFLYFEYNVRHLILPCVHLICRHFMCRPWTQNILTHKGSWSFLVCMTTFTHKLKVCMGCGNVFTLKRAESRTSIILLLCDSPLLDTLTFGLDTPTYTTTHLITSLTYHFCMICRLPEFQIQK